MAKNHTVPVNIPLKMSDAYPNLTLGTLRFERGKTVRVSHINRDILEASQKELVFLDDATAGDTSIADLYDANSPFNGLSAWESTFDQVEVRYDDNGEPYAKPVEGEDSTAVLQPTSVTPAGAQGGELPAPVDPTKVENTQIGANIDPSGEVQARLAPVQAETEAAEQAKADGMSIDEINQRQPTPETTTTTQQDGTIAVSPVRKVGDDNANPEDEAAEDQSDDAGEQEPNPQGEQEEAALIASENADDNVVSSGDLSVSGAVDPSGQVQQGDNLVKLEEGLGIDPETLSDEDKAALEELKREQAEQGQSGSVAADQGGDVDQSGETRRDEQK